MTVHDLHDALNLLSGDLITATDKLRTAPKQKVIPWRRWASLAAVLALVVGTTFVFQKTILPGMDGASAAAAQAPAAMAPEMKENGIPTEAAAEEAATQEAPAADMAADSTAGVKEEPSAGASSNITAGDIGTPTDEELFIDHNHRFAEETEEDESAVGYCGNMMTTIYLDGAEHTFAGSDSVAVTDILINLDYDPDLVCRCAAEFTVDTEMITNIQVNLTEGFARCEKGQAALTEKQAQTIQEIIDSLG